MWCIWIFDSILGIISICILENHSSISGIGRNMTKSNTNWNHTRKIEGTLEDKIERALRDNGVPDHIVNAIIYSRDDRVETILPETDREIEWRLQESRRIARHFGLNVPGLNDSR